MWAGFKTFGAATVFFILTSVLSATHTLARRGGGLEIVPVSPMFRPNITQQDVQGCFELVHGTLEFTACICGVLGGGPEGGPAPGLHTCDPECMRRIDDKKRLLKDYEKDLADCISLRDRILEPMPNGCDECQGLSLPPNSPEKCEQYNQCTKALGADCDFKWDAEQGRCRQDSFDLDNECPGAHWGGLFGPRIVDQDFNCAGHMERVMRQRQELIRQMNQCRGSSGSIGN